MAVHKRHKTLARGRPPMSKPKERMTSDRSRTIIRTHHRLQKEHAAALKKGDTEAAKGLAKAIEENGGIQLYQAASKQGQAKDRGGDSSKQLVEWLHQLDILTLRKSDSDLDLKPILRCLEIGALSTKNEISKFPSSLHMTRIDLNSQGSGIDKQDFMERPLPLSDEQRFDIISLSLVLNYVPDAPSRGEMLKRITKFLRRDENHADHTAAILPALFLVLPLPCIANSRYLNEPLFLSIMKNLGFQTKFSKNTSKLCYFLFIWSGNPTSEKVPKQKIADGPAMNNFCIVVE